MDLMDNFKIWEKNDWGRNTGLYWFYVKGLYTIQSYRTNVFEATKLLDTGLWVGNLCSALDKDGLQNNGIDTIITAIFAAKCNFPWDFHYERANLRDLDGEDIIIEIERLLPIIHEKLLEGKGVLVQCVEGRSRSVSICIAYFVKYLEYTVEDALEYIKEKRSCVKPNEGYLKQLREFEIKVISKRDIGKKTV